MISKGEGNVTVCISTIYQIQLPDMALKLTRHNYVLKPCHNMLIFIFQSLPMMSLVPPLCPYPLFYRGSFMFSNKLQSLKLSNSYREQEISCGENNCRKQPKLNSSLFSHTIRHFGSDRTNLSRPSRSSFVFSSHSE